jgi:hypothetical protein
MSAWSPHRARWLGRLVALKLIGSVVAGSVWLAFAPTAALAQNEEGQITIIVVDATSEKPLSNARVLLDGPVMTSELTTSDGRVLFRDAPAGVYTARVGKSGYQAVTTSSFEVVDGKAVEVSVRLAVVASGVKSLGVVSIKSSANISTTSISQDSTIRKLSPTLNDALNKLAGVSVGTDSTGNDVAETISLEGHDPSQTQVMLGGIPLNSPGVAGDLRSISSDLFAGASVSFNPVAGALAGSVNYRTLEPTRAWQFGINQSFGNLSAASTILSLQGTAGGVGVAYVHAMRGSDNLLNGQTYLDTSGFDYLHEGANQTGGDLVKLRTLLGGTNSISAMYISSNGYNDALCTVDNGPLPCGYGPGNSNYRHLSLESLSDTALVGMTTVQFSLFGSQGHSDRDLLNRYLDGVYDPFGSQSTSNTRGASLNMQLPSRERHTISFQATSTSSNAQTTPLIPSSTLFATGSSTSSYSSFAISDAIKSNDKLSLGEHVGVAGVNKMGASLLAGISAQWSPNAQDAFAGSLDYGNNGSGPARFGVLSDPASIQFDCSGALGYGAGPGDAAGEQTGLTARAGWQHRFGSFGSLSASLYHQQQDDTLLNAMVNGSAFPNGYFPTGYFAALQEIYQSGAGCGTPAALFGPTNLYLNVPVSGVTMVYEGIQLNGDFNLTRELAVEPFYTTQVVKPTTGDPLLTNAFSPIISGSQLPGAPLHQAGITLDYKAPHSAVEWLADGRYVSPGNRNYLPGYVTADVGVGIDFAHGSLTVAESNIFNKFGYEFASSSYAVGTPTVDEGPLPQIARPLAPRQLTVTYSVKVGYGQSTANLPSAGANATGGGAGGGPNDGGPPGGGPGGPGGGRGFFGSAPALPSTSPATPFAADTARQSCTPQYATQSNQALAAMKAYADAIEAQKTAAGYPETLNPQPPAIAGFTVAYHPLQTTYALTFTPQTFTGLRGFIGCATVHVGTKDQAQALHLYIPESSSFFRNPLAFTPAAGLYIVRQPPPPGQEQFRVYKLPTSPPQTPLAIVESDRCTSDLKPAAQSLLASLGQYVSAVAAGQATPAQPTGWTIVPHPVAKGYWLELQPGAPVAIPALLNCAHVSAGSADEIKAAGFGAGTPPSLNYTPALGLYTQRRQQPTTQTPTPTP